MIAITRPAASAAPETAGVVCVDLDGTLIAGDLLWEQFIWVCTRRPWSALGALLTLRHGRAAFKQRVAAVGSLSPETLPYRPALLTDIHTLRQQGAHVVLATASDEQWAGAVARHLGVFSEVLASDGVTNMSGRRKAAALEERFGAGGFHYVGNDWSDVPVWRAAGAGTAVAASPRLIRFLKKERIVGDVHETRHTAKALLRALRPHQWVKNLLVFVPLIGAHRLTDIPLLLASLLMFTTFSLCASAIYVINDICDIDADRQHPRKRTRPFASGELSIPFGVGLATALLSVACAVTWFAGSWPVAGVLATYIVITSAYSLVLKHRPVVDVFTLTGLYVLRIVGGGLATMTFMSSWLLGFALFLFLSLAFIKRYTELMATKRAMPGRAYGPDDAMWMHAIGTSAGYMAVLVLALYVNAPDVTSLYSRPRLLWCLCPLLLFWVTRLWFRAGRGGVHDDPVVEALTDWVSYVGLAAMAAIVFAAI